MPIPSNLENSSFGEVSVDSGLSTVPEIIPMFDEVLIDSEVPIKPDIYDTSQHGNEILFFPSTHVLVDSTFPVPTPGEILDFNSIEVNDSESSKFAFIQDPYLRLRMYKNLELLTGDESMVFARSEQLIRPVELVLDNMSPHRVVELYNLIIRQREIIRPRAVQVGENGEPEFKLHDWRSIQMLVIAAHHLDKKGLDVKVLGRGDRVDKDQERIIQNVLIVIRNEVRSNMDLASVFSRHPIRVQAVQSGRDEALHGKRYYRADFEAVVPEMKFVPLASNEEIYLNGDSPKPRINSRKREVIPAVEIVYPGIPSEIRLASKVLVDENADNTDAVESAVVLPEEELSFGKIDPKRYDGIKDIEMRDGMVYFAKVVNEMISDGTLPDRIDIRSAAEVIAKVSYIKPGTELRDFFKFLAYCTIGKDGKRLVLKRDTVFKFAQIESMAALVWEGLKQRDEPYKDYLRVIEITHQRLGNHGSAKYILSAQKEIYGSK